MNRLVASVGAAIAVSVGLLVKTAEAAGVFVPPEDRSALEFYQYMDSSATEAAYVDTGYVPNANTVSIEFKGAFLSYVQYSRLFANYVDEETTVYRVILQDADNKGLYTCFGSKASVSLKCDSAFSKYGDVLEGELTSGRTVINGKEFTREPQAGNANDKAIFLHADNKAAPTRIWYVRVYETVNGEKTLVRDYCPCVKDGVAGYYDAVENKFYEKTGGELTPYEKKVLTVTGEPGEFGTPSPAYGLVQAAVGDTLVFSAPEGTVTNKSRHLVWTATGWTLKLADGTETSGPETTKTLIFAEQHRNATFVWNFAVSPLPVSDWGTSVNGHDYVYLVRGDTSILKDQNSFHLGTNWSDEAVPHEDADYLVDLGPGKYLRTNGAAYPDPFTGRSLTFGNAETNAEGWLCFDLVRPVTINDARLVRGGFYLPASPAWRSYSGSITVYSTAEAPFAFEAGGRVELHHEAPISGAADAVFVLRPRDGAKSLAEQFEFRLGNETLATNYHGKIIVEGTNVLYTVTRTNSGALPPYWLGDQPAEFMPDAVTLKNGGGIGLNSAYGIRFEMGTRGITVGEGGGTLSWTGSGRPFRAQITGEGILRVAGSGCLFRAMQIDCAGVSVCTNAHMCLHEDVVWGAATTLEVKNGGSITTMSTGLRPIRTRLESGARIICGVACAPTPTSSQGRYYNDGALMLYRRMGGDVGTLELTEGSEIALDGRPIILRLEDERVDARYEGRLPMLKIPTSVRAVTAEDFTVERTKGNAGMGQPDATVDRIVEVETVGGMQTVFLTLPQSYVVPAGTPGVEPAEPYDTWETAATDLETGVAYAVANNRNLNVGPGTYVLKSTLNVSAPIIVRSDDGTGNLARETTVIDGGATPEDATTGVRPVVLAKSGAALLGFTIRNGVSLSDSGGGVRMSAASTLVADCFVTNCVATNTSYNAGGGGIYLGGNQSDVLRTTVVDCKANNGGGIYVGGDTVSAYGSAADYTHRVIGCRIIGNEATHKDINATGGGIDATSRGGLWVEDTFFRGNWLTCTDGINSSNRRGAAMELSAYSIVTNCVFEKHGSGTRGIIDGGNPCKVTGCVFRGLTGTSGQIVGDNNLTASIVENCVFSNNSAQVLYSNAHFKNCLFAYNTAQLNTQSALFENCTVVTNARGFHIESGTCKPKFINCVSAGNGNLSVSNSRGWNNFCFIWQESTNNVTVSNCCFEGVTRWTNDMSGMPPEVWSMETLDPTGKSFAADPKFVDKANGDFRLKRRSPCRDAGILRDWMAEDVDLDGLPRVVTDGKTLAENPDALPDMGCYENQAPCPGLLLLVW